MKTETFYRAADDLEVIQYLKFDPLLYKWMYIVSSSLNVSILIFVSAGEWSVSPQCGWSWGLPSPGLNAPFPPQVHLSALPGPSSTRLACLPHLQVYKKTEGGGIYFKWQKKTVIPYHSHHQRTKILPDFTRFKGEQKTTKKGGKRTTCYTEVLYLETWKQGCFHFYFFFPEIIHTSLIYFFFFSFSVFVLLEFMHFCN